MKFVARRMIVLAMMTSLCCVVWMAMPQRMHFVRALPPGITLLSGDVVLLGSSTWRGRLLKVLDGNSFYAHTGILDREGNGIYLVHADPCRDTVVRERLDAYLLSNRVERVMVMRVENSGQSAEMAAVYARDQWKKARRFDNTFCYGEGNGFYCTELVLCSWQSAGVALLPNIQKGDRVFPSELLGSLHLKVVVECNGEALVYGDVKHIPCNGNANRNVQTNRMFGITWSRYPYATRQAARRSSL